MNIQKHNSKEKVLRSIVWTVAELFTIACLLYSIWIKRNHDKPCGMGVPIFAEPSGGEDL